MAKAEQVIKVGDELALGMGRYTGYRIFTVQSVSPKGRITVALDQHVVVLDPDLTVRGSSDRQMYGLKADPVTDKIREEIALRDAVDTLEYKLDRKLSVFRYRLPKDPDIVQMILELGYRAEALLKKLEEMPRED